jgi:cyclophilin family peptidyl-prolyl cis-trans isomerase
MTGFLTHSKCSRLGVLFTLSVAFLVAPLVSSAADDTKASKTKASVTKASGAPTTSDPAVVTIDEFIAKANIDTSNAKWKTSLTRPPKASFTKDKTYFWLLKTNKGNIKIKLLPAVAPMHVSSTIYLTRLGFYDDLLFHRVISNFMAQGGDPLGNGRGGPGYKYRGEFDKSVKHDKAGKLSMANSGPGTDGSQFFLTFVPTPHLDGKHTIFGEVVEGMGTVSALEDAGSGSGKTSEKVFIEKASILVE